MQTELRATKLVKSFHGVRVLDELSIALSPSKITAIIGPNGAGKTTFIDALTGFLLVDEGKCFLGRTEITELRPEQIAKLGVARTFQDVRLVWQETVLENVMVGVRSPMEQLSRALGAIGAKEEHERIRARAIEALNTVELQSYEQVPATSLSYGQQKLLALARCIATNSGWIILDEPVSGVALPLVESLISMIRRLSTEGRSVVFIEHDIQAVRALADVVVVLDQGRVVISGPTNDVLERSDLLEAYLGR